MNTFFSFGESYNFLYIEKRIHEILRPWREDRSGSGPDTGVDNLYKAEGPRPLGDADQELYRIYFLL